MSDGEEILQRIGQPVGAEVTDRIKAAVEAGARLSGAEARIADALRRIEESDPGVVERIARRHAHQYVEAFRAELDRIERRTQGPGDAA